MLLRRTAVHLERLAATESGLGKGPSDPRVSLCGSVITALRDQLTSGPPYRLLFWQTCALPNDLSQKCLEHRGTSARRKQQGQPFLLSVVSPVAPMARANIKKGPSRRTLFAPSQWRAADGD